MGQMERNGMISSQVIRECIEKLHAITRIEFSVQDTAGAAVAATPGMEPPDREVVQGFAGSPADSQIMGSRYLLKVMEGETIRFILTAMGGQEHAFMIGKVAVSELEQLIAAYQERYDRNGFFQDLLLDNLLPVDIHNRAKKLHIGTSAARAIILFELPSQKDLPAAEFLSHLFSSRTGDYLTAIDENRMILIKSLPEQDPVPERKKAAETAVDMLNMEAMIRTRAACGSIVHELKDLSRSYKEAVMAMEVGRIFYPEQRILTYEELGLGRLIYQLPPTLCRMFIAEIFGSAEPLTLDQELLTTIHVFFENNLNVSETARKLYLHRNTLVYRLEKLQKSTGLDIRKFEDAMTLQIAMMVSNYLKEQNN